MATLAGAEAHIAVLEVMRLSAIRMTCPKKWSSGTDEVIANEIHYALARLRKGLNSALALATRLESL